MRVNIFRQEFRMRLRSVITWSAALAVLILVYISMFSPFADQAELLNTMMARFPRELLMAFGLTEVNLATIPGFYSFVFLVVQVCLAIQAANYGFGLVSVEEREWTADFLLTKPVRRAQLLTSKVLAALCGLTITNAVVWASTFACIGLLAGNRPYEARPVVLMLLSIVIFQSFFLSVGLAISLVVKQVRNVTPYAMALGFGMYLFSVFGEMLGENVLEKITPFKHFEPRYIVRNGTYDWPLVAISVAVIGIALVGSYLLYARRNIPAAI